MQQTHSMAEFPAANVSPAELETTPQQGQEAFITSEPRSLVWAYRLFWLTFLIFFASTGAGKLWDRVWHLTVRFDTFWSPPHFFVFVMTMISGLLVAGIAFTPVLRQWYGPIVRVPFMRWYVSGTLVILGGGLIALTITITLDNFWHSAFGLDETQWSVPHCMLGWCWFTIIIGFIAARMAFHKYRPINWVTHLIMALLVMEFLCPAILGPFYLMYSPNLIHALANVPIVRGEPSAQHMYRIYLHYSLSRQTNPLYIPFVALFAGTAITFLKKLEPRYRVFLLAPFIWSLTLMARDLYTIYFIHYQGVNKLAEVLPVALKEPSLWVPIPIFVAVTLFALLEKSSLTENRILGLVGIVFGICTFFIWHTSSWMILLAIPAALTCILGGKLGKWIFHLIQEPSTETLMRFLLTTCAQIPAVLGIADLFMRRTTP